MNYRIIVVVVLFSLLSYPCFSQNKLFTVSNNMEEVLDSVNWINSNTLVTSGAFSGNKYSALDSISHFSIGYKGEFPETCRNKNLKLIISEYIKVEKPHEELSLILTISFGDSVIVWDSKKVNSRVTSPNTWIKITDEFDIPASLTKNGYLLSVYLWNHDKNHRAGIDDLSMEFYEKKMLSFLPDVIPDMKGPKKLNQILTTGRFSVFMSSEDDNIIITCSKEDTLISSLALLTEWYEGKKFELKQSIESRFRLTDNLPLKGNDTINLVTENDHYRSEIAIMISEDVISFQMSTVFRSKLKLHRHTLVLSHGIDVNEVYDKRTISLSGNLRDEYWLGHGGYKLTGLKNSIVMFRPEKASSVQLDVKNNTAFFNLDFAPDHPMLHFPLMKKSEGKFIDYSFSLYDENERINLSVDFYLTKKDFRQVNILNNPHGYLSSMVWTEHADYSDLRTHKAVYLGSEKINSLNESTGGFLRNSIPVTKSIFYSNPDMVNNSEKAGFMPGPVANLTGTEGFINFLKLLNESGIEICLHTPEHYTTNRQMLSEALDRMRHEFAPVTWIDHGYDNSERSNREDLNCDGADSTSKWYAGDLWKKYGIKYFWNSFFEDSAIYARYGYNSFFSVPYSGWDEAMPTPLYWKHPTRTGEIIHWKTTNTLDPADGSLWNYLFSDERLNDMINNRNDIILHCYTARVDSTTGFYDIKNGEVVVNEEFNNALARLSSKRLEGKIHLSTIRDLLNYRTSLEDITYQIKSDKVIFSNRGKAIIRGVTFAAKAEEVEIEGKIVNKKMYGDELIFWIDLEPGESVTIDAN